MSSQLPQVHHLLHAHARTSPHDPALVLADAELSYAALSRRALGLAQELRDRGIGPECVVGICLERSFDMFVAVLAVLTAGGAYLPLDPDAPQERVAWMCAAADTAFVLSSTTVRARQDQPGWLALDELGERSDDIDLEAFMAEPRPRSLAYVIFTSGSSGRPKGVQLEHGGLYNLAVAQRELFDLGPGKRVLQFAPLAFDAATWEWVMALCWGASLCLLPRGVARSAELGAWMRRYALTHATLPPAVLPGLAPEGLPELEQLILAGESCPASVAARWTTDTRAVWNAYGPTEATVCATAGRYDPRAGEFPIGGELPGVRVHILDPQLEPVAPGQTGELCIGGAGVARGYLGGGDPRAPRFVPDPFAGTAGARLYRSGDRARRRPDGALEFLGRMDRQVKIRGYRVEPEEVEAVLASHPMVDQAAVLARGTSPRDRRLEAYLVCARAERPTAPQLRAHAAASLPAYMIPSALFELDAMPLTTNGKIDASRCPDMSARRLDESSGPQPSSATQRMVAVLFTELLEIAEPSLDSDFFELGGSSLEAAELSERLGAQLGVALPPTLVFEVTTVRALAGALDLLRGALGSGQVSVSPIPRTVQGSNSALSYAQQRLWFLSQTGLHASDYNLPIHLRMRGQLIREALAGGLVALARRHTVLRTRIETSTEGEAHARRVEASAIRVEVCEPCRDTNALASRLAELEARSFDLGREVPIRAYLIELAPDDHVLSIVIHHVAFDGWSARILARDLSALYRAELEGVAPELPRLTIQYADYAAWQRAQLDVATRERLLGYWREQLRDLVPLRLPGTGQPSVSRPHSRRGAIHEFTVSAALTAKLRALAGARKRTLNALMLAAFAVVCGRVCGRDEVTLGSPVAGREHPELRELIGFFVNPLVLRFDLGGDPSLGACLDHVHAVLSAALEHQALPFDLLVRELSPARTLREHPLFQVVFVVQDSAAMVPCFELPGLEVERMGPSGLAGAAARLDQEWHLWVEEGELRGVCAYDSARFCAADLSRMSDSLLSVLEQLVTAIDAPLSSLELDAAADAVVEGPELDGFEGVHATVARQAQLRGTAPALALAGAQLSYAELRRRSVALGQWLRDAGVGSEDIVAVCVPRSFELVVALLAILEAGAAYLPLDPQAPRSRLSFMIEDARPRLLLTCGRVAAELGHEPDWCVPAELRVVELDGPQIVTALADVEVPVPVRPPPVDPEQLAYVIYTSGSSGKPKGVLLEHAGLANLAAAQAELFGVGPGSQVLQFASVSFDAATWEWVMALSAGGCLHLLPDDVPRSGELGSWMQKLEISHATLPPALLPSLEPSTLPALETLILAGEVCPPSLAAIWARGPQVWNAYGPTETTVCATAHAWDPEVEGFPIGRPLPGLTVHILDEDLRPVPAGEVGELCVGGVAVARGYLGRPHLNAHAFIEDPSGGRLYRTGDLGRRRAEGTLEFLGRRDRQVKIRGHRVELDEVEAVLRGLPALDGAAVVVHETRAGERQIVAYLDPASREAPERGPAPPEHQIQAWRQLYDEYAYAEPAGGDPLFNTAGWVSSFSERPLPVTQMRSWVEDIVGHVLAGQPKRVWEIGCGCGLLLFRIAPHCERYLGTDLSAAGIAHVGRQLEADPARWAHVNVEVSEALALDGSPTEDAPFDTIILSSVVQYFPSLDYLSEVLAQCSRRLTPGGRIVLGDVRNLRLLGPLRAAIAAERGDVASEERELLVDPGFFAALPTKLPAISEVEIALERDHQNELGDFRYHAVLHVGRRPATTDAPASAWIDARAMSVDDVLAALRRHTGDAIGFAGLRNRRVAPALALTRESTDDDPRPTIEPDMLRLLGETLGFRVEVCWAHGAPGDVDVAFTRPGIRLRPPLIAAPPMQALTALANRPVPAISASASVPDASLVEWVRGELVRVLPEVMIPARWVVLDTLPLTSNGKIDYAALPPPANTPAGNRDPAGSGSTSTERALCQLFAEVLERESVDREGSFFALGGHSLLAITLVARIRQRLRCELPLPTLFDRPTPATLAAFIDAQGGAAATTNEELEELEALAVALVLDDEIRATRPWSGTRSWSRPLLTGASGFVGAYLLRELLDRSEVERVTCLVRARDPDHGMARIQTKLVELGLWREDMRARILAVPGDLSRPRLGLSPPAFANLARACDLVIHNGAAVNFFHRYGQLEPTNVGGTRELLRLASADMSRPLPLHFVSTLGVFEGLARSLAREGREQPVVESDVPALFPASLATGYSQSKSVAEGLIELARARGLPVSIYRPAAILGDSQTGACSRQEFLVDLLIRGLDHNLLPDFRLANYMIPVDQVSRFVVASAVHGPRSETVANYHLMAGANVEMPTIAAWLAAAGLDFELRPLAGFVAAALAPGAPAQLRDLVPLLELEASLGDCMDGVDFSRGNYLAQLERCGIADFVPDQTYVERCVRWLLEHSRG